MIKRLSDYDVARELYEDSHNNGFSWKGCKVLAEYLNEVEPDAELDVVAIRCDFSEYPSAFEAARDNGWEPDEGVDIEADDLEAEALEWLHDQTFVIEGAFGVIIQAW